MTWALESLKDVHFNGLLLSKLYIVWTKKERSYLSWQWRKVKDLKKNWLSQILTRALESLKIFCFNWLFVTKVYIVWATKIQRSYLSQHWRDMQILKKSWLVGLKKELRNLAKFSPEHLKVSNLGLWWDPFVEKVWP